MLSVLITIKKFLKSYCPDIYERLTLAIGRRPPSPCLS